MKVERPVVWLVHWGLPVLDSGSQRTLQLLRDFASMGPTTMIDVAPTPAAPDPAEPWRYRYDGPRVPTMSHLWRRTLPDVWARRGEAIADAYVREAAAAGVDVLMFSVWPLVPSAASRAIAERPTVLWDGDSHSAYHATRAAAPSVARPLRLHSAWLASRYRRFERRFEHGVDHVTLCGPLDVLSVKRHAEVAATCVPNPVRQVRRTPGPTIYDFGFLGSGWAPNRDGLRWFLRKVWVNVVNARPHATLAVAGTVPFNDQTGVVRLGRVPDKDAFYSQVGAAVVPIDYGSGTQMKLLETAELGIPVYATPYGFQSTTLANLTVLDSAHEWVDRLIRHLDGDVPASPSGFAPGPQTALKHVLGDIP